MKKQEKSPSRRTETMGKVYHTDKLLDQELEHVSEGTDEGRRTYDFYLGKISRSPIVKSRTTGKLFVLPWPDIIKLAVKAGLNRRSPARSLRVE